MEKRSGICKETANLYAGKFWTPDCDEQHKPFEEQHFATTTEAVNFYRNYAAECGFDARQSTVKRNRAGEIDTKIIVCNREGFKRHTRPTKRTNSTLVPRDSGPQRRRLSNRTRCKAKMVLKNYASGGFTVAKFEERHNHCMCTDTYRQFLKGNRKLDIAHKIFLANCVKANIGPAKSFRLFKEMVGGFDRVGAILMEFKNHRRDLLAYRRGCDAQIIVDNFFEKREVYSGFFFDYDLDEEYHLVRLFWTDPTARRNFTYFGDVVSFDATYHTNRYSLVFIPFTGVDNHKRCVTFAAGLLTKEDVESYEWLLENFKKAMGYTPKYIVIDQDPSMKKAVAKVFNNSRHRFCMWHIMTKVGEKVGPELSKNTEFRKKLDGIVWDMELDVASFESKWKNVMEEYGLVDHQWFRQMFELRTFWIPAYFQDVFMGGLVRTTSRSEGENSFFGSYTSHHASLVEFIMHYDNAIEAQQYKEAKLNAECEGHFSDFKTPLALERHAAATYTITMFYEVQSKIMEACYLNRVLSIIDCSGMVRYDIRGGNDITYQVSHHPDDNSAECECGLFMRMGLLCQHILLVYRDLSVTAIPAQYVVARWTREACVSPISENEIAQDVQNTRGESAKTAANKLWATFYASIGLAGTSTDWLKKLTAILQEQNEEFTGAELDTNQSNVKQADMDIVMTPPPVASITILPPVMAKNKGSGKMMKSSREKALDARSKPMRVCRNCKELGRHDNRNFPNN